MVKVLKALVKLNFSAHPGTQLNVCAIMKHLSMHGFQVPVAPRTRWVEALDELSKWVQQVIAEIKSKCCYFRLVCKASLKHRSDSM